MPRQALPISSTVMRNPNVNSDSAAVASAATIRKYNAAIEKIKGLKVNAIVTDISALILKVITTNNTENVTHIHEIAVTVTENKQSQIKREDNF
jgi:hypothetical protein